MLLLFRFHAAFAPNVSPSHYCVYIVCIQAAPRTRRAHPSAFRHPIGGLRVELVNAVTGLPVPRVDTAPEGHLTLMTSWRAVA